MSTTDKYPPPISKLFAPKVPFRYLPPTDVDPRVRKTQDISGVADFLHQLLEHHQSTPVLKGEVKSQSQLSKKEVQRNSLKDALSKWNPETDPHIMGDPYKTVFVGRLDYSTTELDLQQVFSNYGEVEKIRVVRDKTDNKSKGYAFVLFRNTQDAKAAYDRANGINIKNRKVVVDIERGRAVKNWKPRRLGGGLGGRTVKTKTPFPSTPRFSSGANNIRSAPRGYQRDYGRDRYDGGRDRYDGGRDRYENGGGYNRMPPPSYRGGFRGGRGRGRGGRRY